MFLAAIKLAGTLALSQCALPDPVSLVEGASLRLDGAQRFVVADPERRLNPDTLLRLPACEALGKADDARPSPQRGQRSWSVLRVRLPSTESDWALRVPYSGMREVCTYWPLQQGGWRTECAGLAPEGPADIIRGQAQPVFLLPPDLDTTRPILLSGESPFVRLYPIEVAPLGEILRATEVNRLRTGLYYGLLIAIVAYGLLLFYSTREYTVLAFGAYIGLFGAGLFFLEGYHADWLGPGWGALTINAPYLILAGCFLAGCLFLSGFLRTREGQPWMHYVLWGAGWGSVGLMLLAGLSPASSWWSAEAGGLLFPIAGLAVAGNAVRVGRAHAGPLLIGFAMLVVAIFAATLMRTGWLPAIGIDSLDVLRVGPLLAGLALGFAIERQMVTLRRQRDRASLLADTHQRIALYRAQFDSVTSLPNRNRFAELLSERIAAGEGRRVFGLLCIDLDRFKSLRHILGHDNAKDILVAVADRLRRFETGGRVLGRIEADEFALLVPLAADQEMAIAALEEIARAINAGVAVPFSVDGQDVRVTASIGGTLYPFDGNSGERLFHQCEAAIFEAKEAGGDGFALFGTSEGPGIHDRWRIRTRLSRALDKGKLEVYYQPIIDLRSGTVVQLEALTRWQDELLGEVMPSQFIPVAESFNLIDDLSRQMINEVCEAMQSWREDGMICPQVAINVSPRQLRDGRLHHELLGQLKQHRLPCELISVEITENTLVENLASAQVMLAALTEEGIKITVDDFGVGYSSLTYLRSLPVDALKIDRSFISRLGESPEEETLVMSILDLARNLGLKVVGEGVENSTQVRLLRRHGCDMAQGYLFGRPAPKAEILDRLRRARVTE
jgi:diguanylate cyclase